GGLAYWGARQAVSSKTQDPETPSDLWNALAEKDQPRGRRTVRFNRETGTVRLTEDLDGDGRADRWREFRDGRLIDLGTRLN
ncbi:MAG: hypothetical protein N2C14_14700, partial [Planctomycetales bacterium]